MGVGGVSDDVMDSAETASVLDFLDGWKRSPGRKQEAQTLLRLFNQC